MNYRDDEWGFFCGNDGHSGRRTCYACRNRLTLVYGQWVTVPPTMPRYMIWKVIE